LRRRVNPGPVGGKWRPEIRGRAPVHRCAPRGNRKSPLGAMVLSLNALWAHEAGEFKEPLGHTSAAIYLCL
jgi:hypothetical protein